MISKNSMIMSDFKVLLHKVTSNEKSFPEQAELNIVAKHSFYKKENEQMVKHVFKKLQGPYKKWRKILKTLYLMDAVMKKGSRSAVREFKNKVFLVKNLFEFSYIEGTMDRGIKSKLNSKRAGEGACRGHRSRRS